MRHVVRNQLARIAITGASGSQVFDHIVEHSDENPENVPATLSLQEKFGSEMRAFESRKSDLDATQVLVWDECLGVHQKTFAKFEQIQRQLPDLMTCGYHVIAVVADGKALKAEEIDRMKREALEELKDMPISYAQASGRMFPPTVLN